MKNKFTKIFSLSLMGGVILGIFPAAAMDKRTNPTVATIVPYCPDFYRQVERIVKESPEVGTPTLYCESIDGSGRTKGQTMWTQCCIANHEVAGFIEYRMHTPQLAVVDHLATKKSLRRNGCGLLLMCYALNHVQALGAKSVFLSVGEVLGFHGQKVTNNAARSLYKKLGFKGEGVFMVKNFSSLQPTIKTFRARL